MAKKQFPEIGVKAAVITGAFVGLLLWVLGVAAGFGNMPIYSFAYSMMGGYGYGYGMMGYYGYAGIAAVYLAILAAAGALAGAVIAVVYNWALKLK